MRTIAILLCVSTLFALNAVNPVITGIGMSDPHIRVFNDTLYLYSGHDDTPEDKLWVMKDWRVFSSTDFLQWTHETTISPKDNYMDDNTSDCWAGDAASRNGQYYFYFSDQKRGIGVMTADHPGGHFKDALGKPLVSPMHDPTLFVDDDKNQTPYLVYGDKAGGGFRIAQVNEDMISLAETPKPIVINGEEWEAAPRWMDKNFLFKYKDTYYLSWGRDYAISKDVYGPYESVGAVGNGFNLNELAHGSFFWYHGQFYHIWTYYIRQGFKYRECIISYCHIDEAGKLITDMNFLNKHFKTGVGQYNSSWFKIEAEWYSAVSENITKQTSADGGLELTNIKDGEWLKFANVNFDSEATIFSAQLSDIAGKGYIQVVLDDASGEIIAELPIFKSNNDPSKLSCTLKDVAGIHDVYLKFEGNKCMRLDLDFIQFSK